MRKILAGMCSIHSPPRRYIRSPVRFFCLVSFSPQSFLFVPLHSQGLCLGKMQIGHLLEFSPVSTWAPGTQGWLEIPEME